MDINKLILIVKEKLESQISVENIKIEDKSFLHKGHKNNDESKFHLKITLASLELSQMSKIDSNRKIYKILDEEIDKYIHSLQILID
jgi:BolA protein